MYTPPRFDRYHSSEHIPRYEEHRTRRWVQRSGHGYIGTLGYMEPPYQSDHRGKHSFTRDCDEHRRSSRRPSLTPSDASGRYQPQRQHSHRHGTCVQQPEQQHHQERTSYRDRLRDTRNYDHRYQEFTSYRVPSHGNSGGCRLHDPAARHGERRHQHSRQDQW